MVGIKEKIYKGGLNMESILFILLTMGIVYLVSIAWQAGGEKEKERKSYRQNIILTVFKDLEG